MNVRTSPLLILLIACGTDAGTQQPPMPDAPGPVPDGVPPTEVRFQRDVVPIFEKSCGAGNDACHSRKPFAANQTMDCRGWLSLENAAIGSQIYAGPTAGQATGCPDMPLQQRLVQLAPWQCSATSKYVKAGDVANSYIVDKIKGIELCPDGGGPSGQMPPADSSYKITAQDLQTIEAWILAGAKDD